MTSLLLYCLQECASRMNDKCTGKALVEAGAAAAAEAALRAHMTHPSITEDSLLFLSNLAPLLPAAAPVKQVGLCVAALKEHTDSDQITAHILLALVNICSCSPAACRALVTESHAFAVIAAVRRNEGSLRIARYGTLLMTFMAALPAHHTRLAVAGIGPVLVTTLRVHGDSPEVCV